LKLTVYFSVAEYKVSVQRSDIKKIAEERTVPSSTFGDTSSLDVENTGRLCCIKYRYTLSKLIPREVKIGNRISKIIALYTSEDGTDRLFRNVST
jgi:hypothetical protein